MTGFDVIDLEVGGGSWLKAFQWALAGLGFTVLLTSAATAAWKAVLLGSLGLACAALVRTRPHNNRVTRLRLFANGNAILYTATGSFTATLTGSGWCSRWCCVLPFHDTPGGRPAHFLLCRSRNTADSYRRLLVHLRLAGPGQDMPGVST